MKKINSSPALTAVITLVRIFLGWHFLYEGISKLASPSWSSAGYLMESKWLFSGVFHWIIAHPTALAVTDFLNIWGLILIGLGLFTGLLTRAASISGIFLMMIYYVANPPFVESSLPAQASYYIINLNMIEAGILLIFAFLGRDHHWSLDRLFMNLWQKKKAGIFPAEENRETQEGQAGSRREWIKNLASIPLLGTAFFGMVKKHGWLSFEEENLAAADGMTGATLLQARAWNMSELKARVPSGKIGGVEISRIIPGGNLVAGFAHARDLIYVSSMIKNYFTDEKVIETLWLYEACGMNTTIMSVNEQTLRILDKYWKRGGKVKWLAQTYPTGESGWREGPYDNIGSFQVAIDAGAVGAFVMGGMADKIVSENRMDDLAKPIEYIQSQGLIAGTAGHAIQVPMACVEYGIEPDFFMKTFHHDKYWSAQPSENRSEFMHNLAFGSLDHDQFHDNIWCPDAKRVAEFFKTSKIPWIAYKVLAAGAIQPEDGFRHAFENGADFICVGMFDFQVIQNANIISEILTPGLKRERSWFA